MVRRQHIGLALTTVYCLLLVAACRSRTTDGEKGSVALEQAGSSSMGYSILNTYPHNTQSFTEGLEFYKNKLYESTGEYGSSQLVSLDPTSGKVLKKIDLAKQYFGEGITILNDTIYQMTYKEKKVFVYTVAQFKLVKTLSFETEGWGLTNNGHQLIMSNGSSTLYFRNPTDFSTQFTLSVQDAVGPVTNLNELEFVDGYIYANVWNTDKILKIDSSGRVVKTADLRNLLVQFGKPAPDPSVGNVLNGIAYNAQTKRFYITGKYWPLLFEISFN